MIIYDGMKVYMNGGYPAVYLNGKNAHIHRLEWMKHNGDIPVNCIIHHKNENKLDWSIENLELLDRAIHIKKHGDVVCKKGNKTIAYKNGVACHFDSVAMASKHTGVYASNICRILNGGQRQSNGWTFERVGELP